MNRHFFVVEECKKQHCLSKRVNAFRFSAIALDQERIQFIGGGIFVVLVTPFVILVRDLYFTCRRCGSGKKLLAVGQWMMRLEDE